MAPNNNSYWQKRFIQYEKKANLKSQSHIKSLEKEYNAAKKAVEKDLKVFYNRLAKNNDLPDAVAAKKLLDANELADFKMSLKEYTQLAKENGITGDWTQKLENASLKYRISRLEAMKLQIEQKATMLMQSEKTGLEKFVKSAYEDAYYNGGFEIAKGTGVGKTLFQLDDKKINKVIHKPWAADGKHFSTRIWGQHRPQLVNNLHRSLTDALTRGTGPDKAIAAISHDFDVSMSAAARIVQTEEAYFSSLAQKDVFSELDVEQYQIIATLDSRTSEVCQHLDGEIFKMSEYEAGRTAPPFHPRCRTTTAPYFADEVSTRAARDPETGQTVQVPADMNYQDWKDSYTIDPATGKTNAQLKAEKKAAEEAAKAKAEAEAKKKAQEEAAAAAKAKAEAEAKAQAEAAQKTKEVEAKAKATKAAKTPEAIISELEGKKYIIGFSDYEIKDFADPKMAKIAEANLLSDKKIFKEGLEMGDEESKRLLEKIKQIEADVAAYKKALAKTAAKKAASEQVKAAAKKNAAIVKNKKIIDELDGKEYTGLLGKKPIYKPSSYTDEEWAKEEWPETITPAWAAKHKKALDQAQFSHKFGIKYKLGDHAEHKNAIAQIEQLKKEGAKYQKAMDALGGNYESPAAAAKKAQKAAALQNQAPAVDLEKTRPDVTVSNIVGHEAVDANTYSQARKDAAYWGKNGTSRDKQMIDDAFREQSGEVWRDATYAQKEGIYDYTADHYAEMNAHLSGYTNRTYKTKLGVGKVALEDRTIKATEYLEKSKLKADVWVNRGTSHSALADFFESFGIHKSEYTRAINSGDTAFFNKILGQKGRLYNFQSTSPVKGAGFDGDVMWNIYCPKGSHAAYVEPFACYGGGIYDDVWDGIEKQEYFSREFEFVLQRGGSYKITKLEITRGQVYIDVELHPEDGWDLYGQR